MTPAIVSGLFRNHDGKGQRPSRGGAESFVNCGRIRRAFRIFRPYPLRGRKGPFARLEAFALGVRRIAYIDDLDTDLLWTPDDLHKRGWSSDAMVRLLGRPDYAILDPLGRREPLIALDRRRVEEVESSPKFRAYMESLRRQAEIAASCSEKWASLNRDLSERGILNRPFPEAGRRL